MASCLRNNKSTSYNCISEFLITAKKNTRHERVSLQMNTTSNTSRVSCGKVGHKVKWDVMREDNFQVIYIFTSHHTTYYLTENLF